ncbi:hypothetical protein HO133_004142 [Letharia lupina]|uniref:Uncharacterized protein n=1 Tax=Letharia lupina TaxID=560253 RepID=A0A8H6C9X0_9LECA|nr:uncharacterized protein HO133_004142 [Letharia lupina]KAF6219673.1 hypothetical protein HO133_004142 [Letharia lupina]
MPPSTVQPLALILTLFFLSLLSSLPPSAASAMCSELYGQPQQQACWQMFHGPDGIPSDANSHLFSLPLRRRPPSVLTTQWRRKQRLPFLRSNGGCKLALLAIELVDHTITYDTTTWADIVESGSLIYNQCVSPTETEGGFHIPSGGYVLTGDHGRLALLLYASGSTYDRQVQADLASGRTVVAEQDPGDGSIDISANTTTANTLNNLLGPILPRARIKGLSD